MEFLELLETMRAEDASYEKLFGDAGTRLGSRHKRGGADYVHRLGEAASFYQDVIDGRRPLYRLTEALSTSDFSNLFGDIIDRQVLANYAEYPATWQNYCKRATVRDFRTVKRLVVNGNEAVLDQVNQFAPYPMGNVSDGAYTYAVTKHGRRIGFSWEDMINDDLDALKDMPARFSRGARRSEQKFATQLHADANGPHASLYTSGNKNIINQANGAAANNPHLSIAGVQDGFTVLSAMVDSDGEPIFIESIELVVPPALEVVGRNILNATELLIGAFGSTSETQSLMTANWVKNKLRLSVNPYLPIVSSSANGNKSWYLFASPSAGRPALEVGFLRGHECPEIWMKEPNARRIGGGTADPMEGDFETDSIEYKLRHVFGGTRMEPKATVASNGSDS
jgi:hypothetical protein